ncbi:GWT1 [Parelaphostrongylus tenuis]|uniref:Phosphatidylinositol-glycan biosynthesis class W protein n=1 Tax=Parelaphostrongylus tenuis TaxID=148309 RepID=A0AAD5WLL7_PARTN|nr:GWT1 [Parelaphostrongylus tenuis]
MVEHASFVGTLSGCNQRELFLAEVVVFLALVLRNVSLPWVFLGRKFNTGTFKYWLKFSLDYIFLVLPGLLVMTVFSQSLLLLTSVLTACLATLLVFIVCEYLISPDRPPSRIVLNRIIDEHHQPTMFLTYFRSALLISVAAAILAVDFPVFPRRFAKTEKYGHSLMDAGVAGFVFAAAVANRVRTLSTYGIQTVSRSRYYWLRSSYVVLPLIGSARTVLLTVMNYPQHVTEYGVHWNFFYTLAVIKVVSNLLPRKFPLLWAFTFGILQQTMLTSGYEEWILNGENMRETLFAANAEGICSLMGYITIFYISDAIAKFVSKTGIRVKSWIECCWRLYVFALIFYIMQLGAEWTLGQPSRRVANISYVFSQMSFFTFTLACFLCVQVLSIIAWAANVPHFCIDENPWYGVQPCLSTSINKSGLLFFLLANIFTGVLNLIIDTHNTDDITAMCILIGYLFCLCLIAHYRTKNNRI